MTWAHAHRQNLGCKCRCASCVCRRRSDQCSFNSMFSFLNMCLLFVVAVVVISGQTLCFSRRGYLTVISFCKMQRMSVIVNFFLWWLWLYICCCYCLSFDLFIQSVAVYHCSVLVFFFNLSRSVMPAVLFCTCYAHFLFVPEVLCCTLFVAGMLSMLLFLFVHLKSRFLDQFILIPSNAGWEGRPGHFYTGRK